MISNNKISHVISSEVPFFVRNDHESFVKFLEAYYKFLEQEDETVNRIKNLRTYQDIDLAEDEFAERLYSTFMRLFPENIKGDRALILKHIKDFYRAKGTEKAIRFLFRVLFQEEIEFYYPKKDVLRASDGKWYIQKSLRVNNNQIDGIPDTTVQGLQKFIGTKIFGVSSNSSAIVEKVERFYEQGALIDELIISNIDGEFDNGEGVFSYFDDIESTRTLTANIYSGIINSITIVDGGTLYQVGDPVIVVSATGTGACATVASVTTGDVLSLGVLSGGAGFRANDYILFSGGGGSGANAIVSIVKDDSTVHPNTYNIVSSIISLEANTPIGNSVYSNLSFSNANVAIQNAMSFFQYANTGPAQTILVLNKGSNYSAEPNTSIIANSQVISLGILGRMEIVGGGSNYRIGDPINFENVPGGYGYGARAVVSNVNVALANSISEVRFVSVPGEVTGGVGYSSTALPKAVVSSNTGSGANVVVTAVLGTGAELRTATSSIGSIRRITVLNRGLNYDQNTTIDLSGSGDGLARANVSTIQGLFSYPGRYLNDDGHISSYNFLQDRDYYQNFSYVIRSKVPTNQYRTGIEQLTHPAGTKMFGEYMFVDTAEVEYDSVSSESSQYIIKTRSYVKTGNSINVSYSSHGKSNGTIVYLEFLSGNYSNVKNGVYQISFAAPNFFRVTANNANSTLGNVAVGFAI